MDILISGENGIIQSVEHGISVLKNGHYLYFWGLDNARKWLSAKPEDVGVTLRFGNIGDTKVISKRWYPNGWKDIENYLEQFEYGNE